MRLTVDKMSSSVGHDCLVQQVAQQEAQRAAFIVDRAKQEKQQKIVQAEGEATAAEMLGEAISKNPGYLKLRKLRASAQISKTVSFTSAYSSSGS